MGLFGNEKENEKVVEKDEPINVKEWHTFTDDDETYRMLVPGGWLVLYLHEDSEDSVTMCFVPDQGHMWAAE